MSGTTPTAEALKVVLQEYFQSLGKIMPNVTILNHSFEIHLDSLMTRAEMISLQASKVVVRGEYAEPDGIQSTYTYQSSVTTVDEIKSTPNRSLKLNSIREYRLQLPDFLNLQLKNPSVISPDRNTSLEDRVKRIENFLDKWTFSDL